MRFDLETVGRWQLQAAEWLKANTAYTPLDVVAGVDAWSVAHRCGITAEAYKDREVTDGHIQTALKRVFPNAKFKDKAAY